MSDQGFIAVYSGRCAECHGEMKNLRVRHDSIHNGALVHVMCPDDVDIVADRQALAFERCERCGLNHPGEC